jgi:hypothetical protein
MARAIFKSLFVDFYQCARGGRVGASSIYISETVIREFGAKNWRRSLETIQ